MKIEQLSKVLGKQSGNSNAERMNEAVRTVLTKDAELRSKGKKAYNEARQRQKPRDNGATAHSAG